MKDIINCKNMWEAKLFNYRTHQLSKDENGLIWVNIGWHLPLSVNNNETFNKILSVSAYEYIRKFN